MYRVRKNSTLASTCLQNIRRTLAACGAAYDLYSIMDLKLSKMDGYKLYIFVNQYDISEETKEQITNRLKKAGKTILWMYAPDYVNGGNNDVKHMSDITNINISVSDTAHGAISFNDNLYNFKLAAPYFAVEDNAACPLAYFEDGTVAVAYKELKDFRSVYVATCNLPADLLRQIVMLAGVFVYSDNKYVYVYPNSASIGVYNATAEDAIISLKEDGTYKDLLCGRIFECKDGKLTLPVSEINAFLLVKDC